MTDLDPRALIDVEGCADLLTRIAALGGREPSHPAAQMWAEILAEVRYGDALAAMVAHYQESPHPCTPHDIYRRVEEWWEWWRVNDYPARFGAYDEGAPIGGDWPASEMLTATQIRERQAPPALEEGR